MQNWPETQTREWNEAMPTKPSNASRGQESLCFFISPNQSAQTGFIVVFLVSPTPLFIGLALNGVGVSWQNAGGVGGDEGSNGDGDWPCPYARPAVPHAE